MLPYQRLVRGTVLLLLAAALGSASPTPAAEKDAKDRGTVAGLVLDKKDNKIKVLPDGKEEPIEYVLPPGSEPRLVKAWNGIFTVTRVRLSYKVDGDTRKVVGISRQVGRPKGVITGVVQNNYKGWWVSVKPRGGVADGFAQSFPFPKEMAATMKKLEKGDVVTIQYYTDFERHRIVTIRKVGKARTAPKSSGSGK